jgi:hypothetical protein
VNREFGRDSEGTGCCLFQGTAHGGVEAGRRIPQTSLDRAASMSPSTTKMEAECPSEIPVKIYQTTLQVNASSISTPTPSIFVTSDTLILVKTLIKRQIPCNEELCHLYSPPSIVRITKS